MLSRALFVCASILCLGGLGCHSTIIRSGKPVAKGDPAVQDRALGATLGNVVVVDPPFRLDLHCKQGWSEIEMRMSPLDWGLGYLSGGVYQSRTFTLRCAKKDSAAPPDAAPNATPAAMPDPNDFGPKR
jgi:hypothetical protein